MTPPDPPKRPKELGAYGVIEGKVTFDAEGNDVSKSPFFSRQVHWPGGRSGVTLGRGYDMGDRSESDVIGDLTDAGLNEKPVNTRLMFLYDTL